MVTCNAIRLAVAVAILGGVSLAQDQNANDAQAEFDRLCFVSWLSTPYEVGHGFSVKLSFRKAPLPDIQVTLTPSGELTDANGHLRVSISAVTDSVGAAHFSAVPSGKYTVGAKDGLQFPSNELTVHTKGDSHGEIAIEWPLVPLPVRTLRGKLITQAEKTDVELPLQPSTVELVDLRSSRVFGNAEHNRRRLL